MRQLAIFASGGGSNARCIMEHFAGLPDLRVALVITNRKDAGVLKIADSFGIPTILLERRAFYDSEDLLADLHQYKIDFIALAGFLWLVPPYLVQAYPGRIVNIHPALLPKYGGKGMYGHHVHEAVKAAGEEASGMTIHYVNEQYDDGDIVFQATCRIDPEDSPEQIAAKVLALEHQHFPRVIAELMRDLRD